MLEVPAHLIAATRLGVAKEAGQVLVVVLDKRLRRRSLWLANDLGVHACSPRYAYKPQPEFTISPVYAALLKRGTRETKPVESITEERRYEVVEHLGNEDEAVRCVALAEADRIGVPIINWPAGFVRYHVEWAPGLWAKHDER